MKYAAFPTQEQHCPRRLPRRRCSAQAAQSTAVQAKRRCARHLAREQTRCFATAGYHSAPHRLRLAEAEVDRHTMLHMLDAQSRAEGFAEAAATVLRAVADRHAVTVWWSCERFRVGTAPALWLARAGTAAAQWHARDAFACSRSSVPQQRQVLRQHSVLTQSLSGRERACPPWGEDGAAAGDRSEEELLWLVAQNGG